MRDAHVDIIHHHAELVHRLPKLYVAFSRAQQHEIFNLVVGELRLSKHGIEKLCCAAHGYLEANRRLRVRSRRSTLAARTPRDAPRSTTFRLFVLGGFGVIPPCSSFRLAID